VNGIETDFHVLQDAASGPLEKVRILRALELPGRNQAVRLGINMDGSRQGCARLVLVFATEEKQGDKNDE
jgi:hypothetical protein